ncbi:MAG: DUF3576 domain-containing protein [Rhodospirillales bacterium]|nr:DUF3576 domain-containing protein [Rhodospirillales bacterium]
MPFRPRSKPLSAFAAAALSALLLAGCGDIRGEQNFPTRERRESGAPKSEQEKANRETIFGNEGLFGGGKKKPDEGGGGGIGVNSFLWRASLDTLAFMPLASADPFGGVIITDWYSPPETPGERPKLNVYIIDRALRADGVKITVFRQVKDNAGGWTDAAVDPSMGTKLEDAVLARARQLRQAQAQ